MSSTRKALGDISNKNRASLNYPGTQLRKGGSDVFDEPLQKPTISIQVTAAKTQKAEPLVSLPDDEEMLCTRWAVEDDLSLCDSPPRMRLDASALKAQSTKAEFSRTWCKCWCDMMRCCARTYACCACPILHAALRFDIQALKEEIDKLNESVPESAPKLLEVPDLGPLPDLSDLDLHFDIDDLI